ncbi:probable ATP-dependent RNA helicase DHX34 isoform X1 [Biomphalaria glabrata]|uniref:Probable ATP-dependent RNA helicase DHX34 isoform X1 n=1 Tax=Biomphalaria glabrata TaxID=6526 RepID=A0A9W2ZVA4_BIOGL|nr:probable ATP-dependent RNA helicase DHX34 isoform X1 [Biomphalaria glabrata]XP_055878844.1 probable ATP-dependent RNA helicase DHX34 isoform X1 [Biomphalaria glabrata]
METNQSIHFSSSSSELSDNDTVTNYESQFSNHGKRKRKRSRSAGADKDCQLGHKHSRHLSEEHKHYHSHSHKRKLKKMKHKHHKSKHGHIDKECKHQHKHRTEASDQDSNSDISDSEKEKKIQKKSQSSSERKNLLDSNPDTETLDYNFDFSKYKASLSRMFFRENFFSKIAIRGSQEHDDFWNFVNKFVEFQRKKAEKSKDAKVQLGAESGQLNLPKVFDVSYKINISFISKDFDVFFKKNRLVDYQLEKELSRGRVLQFRSIILHYLDFQQKQKFQKIYKICKDQRELPIYQHKETIIQMLQKYQVIVVAGDTGCGKSTQVPQYLLEAGYHKIACTQPRRIACISLAKRVGYETLNEYGSEVAYQVRFEKSKTQSTRILFLTEGLLLRQMKTDPLLEMYNIIIIDEVHERHVNTDFLLGVLKCVIKQRSDLKLVLMSATININLFSNYFNGAPVLKVPGRLYPIELEYCPVKTDDSVDSKRLDPRPYINIMQRIDHKHPSTERGDLLIFLSGMSEIMAVVEAAKAYAQKTKRWIVLPLHSALSIEEQDKVFDYAPDGVRKCVVSTNIAETSVTIDGVRFIVDSGKVKEMSFDPKFKMQKLQEFWISRASSEQRKGRAGRTGPGVCYRLYDESDYNSFDEYSTPELQRVPLDSLILQMISMGLPDARKFPFIEPPNMSSVENSIIFLKEQAALASDESLTPIGQMLSMLPVDVVIGKMLIMGSIFNMIDPILSITAAMSVQSPFTNRAYTDHDALVARKPLESEHGDPFTLLNAFDEWIQVKAQGQGTRKWCKRRGLEEQRFYEMTKLKRQFKDLLKDHHLLDREEATARYMSSDERRAQHGERKKLNELRKEKMKDNKRRKFLTLEDEEFKVSDEEGDINKGDDIKDLEFRLSNDLNQLQETSNKSRNFTLRDINLMKIILCSGLYPQVAIPDECNTYRRDTEQTFHTKSKPFVLLHPTSIFASHPDLLTPKYLEHKKLSQSELKGLFSSKHELLAYVSLLETNNKPYLVNAMKVPALQTVTLFSNSIDTNADCTRLIFDSWLEFKFKDALTAEKVISSVIQLRSTWHSLLLVRLKDTFEGLEEDRRISTRARQLERILASKLTEFLNADFLYSIRRVLAAEMQRAYVGPGKVTDQGTAAMFDKILKVNSMGKEHPIKGGIQVTDYLTFNCLLDDASASVWGEFTQGMQRFWKCPLCGQSMLVNVLERLQHEAVCSSEGGQGLEQLQVEDSEKISELNPLRKSYFCTECNKELSLTTTEILKHKKTHLAT